MQRQNQPNVVYSLTETTGVTSSTPFTLGVFDFNTLVAKLYAATFIGSYGSATLDVVLQTQDPSSGTYFDLVHFAQILGTITESNALFATIGSKQLTGYVGSSPSATISAGTAKNIPLLSRGMRIVYTYGGTVGSPVATFQLIAVDQDAR